MYKESLKKHRQHVFKSYYIFYVTILVGGWKQHLYFPIVADYTSGNPADYRTAWLQWQWNNLAALNTRRIHSHVWSTCTTYTRRSLMPHNPEFDEYCIHMELVILAQDWRCILPFCQTDKIHNLRGQPIYLFIPCYYIMWQISLSIHFNFD